MVVGYGFIFINPSTGTHTYTHKEKGELPKFCYEFLTVIILNMQLLEELNTGGLRTEIVNGMLMEN